MAAGVDGQSALRVVSGSRRDARRLVELIRPRVEKEGRTALLIRRDGAAGAPQTRIEIPPLRERPEDIAPLVAHFAADISGNHVFPFSESTMAALRAHRWSGNVRELRNVVESALAMGSVNLDGLSQSIPPPLSVAVPPYRAARADALAAFERTYLRKLIDATGGNASAAARAANMDRPYLLSLLRRHGLR